MAVILPTTRWDVRFHYSMLAREHAVRDDLVAILVDSSKTTTVGFVWRQVVWHDTTVVVEASLPNDVRYPTTHNRWII